MSKSRKFLASILWGIGWAVYKFFEDWALEWLRSKIVTEPTMSIIVDSLPIVTWFLAAAGFVWLTFRILAPSQKTETISPVSHFATSSAANTETVIIREAPHQGIANIDNPAESRNSWLHIQISVVDKNFRMERVRARLLFENPPSGWQNIPGDGLWLRWQSEDEKGDEYKTLEFGVPHLLIAFFRGPRMWWAKEGRQGETACFVTEQNERMSPQIPFKLPPGNYNFSVRLFSGSWEKIGKRYLLNVPHENAENAHFWFRHAD